MNLQDEAVSRESQFRPLGVPLFVERTFHFSLVLLIVVGQIGCLPGGRVPNGPLDTRRSYHDDVGMMIEYPDVQECYSPTRGAAESAAPPLALQNPAEVPKWELALEEAIQLAVADSPVIRSIGGSVVNLPDAAQTVFDPAIVDTNPLGGVEAALSAFDAQWTSQLFWNKVDRPLNSQPALFFQPRVSQQTTATFDATVTKQTAQGAQFALRHNVFYNRSNQPFRVFPSDFTGLLQAEWRQPMMRGAGVLYNRIAGPNSPIGQYRGVLIARINDDVALTNFEQGVIQLVSDVEQAYWELYFAYRNLEALQRGRESTLQTFQYTEMRVRIGAESADVEAQARSQYFQFQAQVENALSGPAGLYELEQRLRYLMGQAPSDGRLILPVSDPLTTRVVFDWEDALAQAAERRVEVRRQKWAVRRRELELYAARLNRRPQFDFLGNYTWRGLGNHLLADEAIAGPLDNSLYASITGGNYQEWQAGVELTFPVGLRQASAAVSNAYLNVARERAVLDETYLQISHDLSNAARQVELSFRLVNTNLNRWQADLNQLQVLRERYTGGIDPISFFLQAQRQVVISQSDYYRALVNYNLAVRDLHRQKGSLLAYNHVQLAETAWHPEAYTDAYQLGRHLTPRVHPEKVDRDTPVSLGPFDPSMPMPQIVPQPQEAVPSEAPPLPPVRVEPLERPQANPQNAR